MENDSEIIKTEIMRILHENGKTRGSELIDRVAKKIGNRKVIYREISSLVESGEIEKKMHSKSYIEYDIVNLTESANNQLKIIYNNLEMILQELEMYGRESSQSKINYHKRIRTVIHFIHIVQSIDGIMKILSYYPTFKKDKMFSQVHRKINDFWEIIMKIITEQQEEEFLNEVISNMNISQAHLETVD